MGNGNKWKRLTKVVDFHFMITKVVKQSQFVFTHLLLPIYDIFV